MNTSEFLVEFNTEEIITTEKEKKENNQKWAKPLDSDGIYDPFVELKFDEFIKLTLNEQVEYLLASIYIIMKEWHVNNMNTGIEITTGHMISIELDRETINPRRPTAKPYNGYNLDYAKNSNHNKYDWVSLTLQEGIVGHRIRQDSALYRTVLIGVLLAFLVKFKPDKFGSFVEAANYYTAALLLGNGSNPPKFRKSSI